MKKAIFFSMFLGLGLVFNPGAFGGCETSLPNTLQACFNSQQIDLNVTVVGDQCIISGNCTTAQVDNAQACMEEYNAGAASCPGAPYLVISGVTVDDNPSTGYNGGGYGNKSNTITPGS
jgi:hypothetical protein